LAQDGYYVNCSSDLPLVEIVAKKQSLVYGAPEILSTEKVGSSNAGFSSSEGLSLSWLSSLFSNKTSTVIMIIVIIVVALILTVVVFFVVRCLCQRHSGVVMAAKV
jgi:hypothetical protein